MSLFSATSGGILDRAVEAEDRKHGDLLRLVIISYFVLPLLPTLSCCMYYCFKIRFHCIDSLNRKYHLNLHLCYCEQDHVEGYLELSAKTKIYFATAVALWDADFYIKVDDDVHVNIGE